MDEDTQPTYKWYTVKIGFSGSIRKYIMASSEQEAKDEALAQVTEFDLIYGTKMHFAGIHEVL